MWYIIESNQRPFCEGWKESSSKEDYAAALRGYQAVVNETKNSEREKGEAFYAVIREAASSAELYDTMIRVAADSYGLEWLLFNHSYQQYVLSINREHFIFQETSSIIYDICYRWIGRHAWHSWPQLISVHAVDTTLSVPKNKRTAIEDMSNSNHLCCAWLGGVRSVSLLKEAQSSVVPNVMTDYDTNCYAFACANLTLHFIHSVHQRFYGCIVTAVYVVGRLSLHQ